MKSKGDVTFLCRRMKELREKNGLNQDEMAEKLHLTKSTISRLEAGKLGNKTSSTYAVDYCKVFGMTEQRQIDQFLRGDKLAVPDTSALLKNPQLIDELNKEYGKVIIAKIVIDELDKIKNANSGSLGRKAWEVIRGISYGDRTILMEYSNSNSDENEDCKIISIAREAVELYGCKADIVTEDTDYSAYLKSDEYVTALHLREYMTTKQDLVNMTRLVELNNFFADDYDSINALEKSEANAYLPDGNTLIISAVRNRRATLEQRKAKVRWLISQGADINKRDCNRRYFPPISHAIQMNDYEMFLFLLNECNANPNIGSRNPQDSGKVRQKNEGNMPLMDAAWDGKVEFVKALCDDERTSINQQDANGFTALIKACANGYLKCRDILLEAGADRKIVDIDDMTYEDRYNEYLELGRMKDRNKSKKKRSFR